MNAVSVDNYFLRYRKRIQTWLRITCVKDKCMHKWYEQGINAFDVWTHAVLDAKFRSDVLKFKNILVHRLEMYIFL